MKVHKLDSNYCFYNLKKHLSLTNTLESTRQQLSLQWEIVPLPNNRLTPKQNSHLLKRTKYFHSQSFRENKNSLRPIRKHSFSKSNERLLVSGYLNTLGLCTMIGNDRICACKQKEKACLLQCNHYILIIINYCGSKKDKTGYIFLLDSFPLYLFKSFLFEKINNSYL